MKRFYKETGVDAGEGRISRPARRQAHAYAGQGGFGRADAGARRGDRGRMGRRSEKAEINAAHLPLTRLAATGIDRVVSRRDEVIADIPNMRPPICSAIALLGRTAWSACSASAGTRCSPGRRSVTAPA